MAVLVRSCAVRCSDGDRVARADTSWYRGVLGAGLGEDDRGEKEGHGGYEEREMHCVGFLL